MRGKESKGLIKILRQNAVPVLIYIAVIALLVLAVNQYLGFKYKVEFLRSPCSLCEDLNEGAKCRVGTPINNIVFPAISTNLMELNPS